MAGALLVVLFSAYFQVQISGLVDLPLESAKLTGLLLLVFESIALALFCTNLAIIFPAWKISHQDPAVAMKG
jgi:ABC-type lipoprotein release transport system permease subunit